MPDEEKTLTEKTRELLAKLIAFCLQNELVWTIKQEPAAECMVIIFPAAEPRTQIWRVRETDQQMDEAISKALSCAGNIVSEGVNESAN